MTSLFVFWSIVSAIFMSPIVQHLSLFFFFLANPSSGDWDDVEKSLQRVQREICKQPLTVTYCFRSLTGIKLKWSPMRRRMSDHHNFFFFLFLFVLFFECSYDCCVHTSSKEKQKASLCSVCVCVHILLISGHVYFLFCFADQKHGTVTKKPQLHPLLKTSLLCYHRKHFGIRAD